MMQQRPRLDQGPDYERGFIDGMQEQMKRSVDRAVNAMAEKQEPIARVTGTYGGRFVVEPLNPAMVLPTNMALYAEPQPKAEKQEPVAWMYQEYRDDDQFGWRDEIQFVQPPNDPNYFRYIVPLYTTQPQRKPFNHHEFGYWWFQHGSGLYPLEGEDQEQHAYRVASEAWKAAHGIKE